MNILLSIRKGADCRCILLLFLMLRSAMYYSNHCLGPIVFLLIEGILNTVTSKIADWFGQFIFGIESAL